MQTWGFTCSFLYALEAGIEYLASSPCIWLQALYAGEMHKKTSPISTIIDLIIGCNRRLGFGTPACVKFPEDIVEKISGNIGILPVAGLPGSV